MENNKLDNYKIYKIYAYNTTILVNDNKNIDRKIDIEYYYDIVKVSFDHTHIYVYLKDKTIINSKYFLRKYPIINDFSIGYPKISFI